MAKGGGALWDGSQAYDGEIQMIESIRVGAQRRAAVAKGEAQITDLVAPETTLGVATGCSGDWEER